MSENGMCCCLGKLFKEIWDEKREDNRGEDFDDEVYGVEKEPPPRCLKETAMSETEATETDGKDSTLQTHVRLDPNG